MAEPTNRTERENDLKAALNLVWNAWVRVADPTNLDPAKLLELLDKHVRQPLWGVWINGHEQLTSNYNKPATDAQIAAAFLLFYRKWADHLIARWVARVTIWMTQRDEAVEATTGRAPSKPTPQTPTIPIQGQPAKPSTPPQPGSIPSTPISTVAPGPGSSATGTSSTAPSPAPSAKPVSLPVVQPPPTWNRSKGDIVMDYDIEREAIDAVTGAQTDAEIDAAKKIEASGQGRFTAIWRTEPGACPICAPLEGTPPSVWQTVAPNGPGLHPNCVLGVTPVLIPVGVAAVKAKYNGPIVRLKTSCRSNFAVTPNHQFLTNWGFIRASDLVQGMKIVRTCLSQYKFPFAFRDPNYDWKPVIAEQVFHAWTVSEGMRTTSMPVAPENLHGDARFVQGYVNIVGTDRKLMDNVDSAIAQPRTNHELVPRNLLGTLPADSLLSQILLSLFAATNRSVGSVRESESLLLGQAVHSYLVSGGSVAGLESHLRKSQDDSCATYAERLAHAKNAFPSMITTSDVLSIEFDTVSDCHVYDFQSESSLYYIGNGLVSSNCRCWLQWSPWLE